jgi:hypothetical protein
MSMSATQPEQQRDLARRERALAHLPLGKLLTEPSLDRSLMATGDCSRRVTRQVGELHDDAREAGALPTGSRRPT